MLYACHPAHQATASDHCVRLKGFVGNGGPRTPASPLITVHQNGPFLLFNISFGFLNDAGAGKLEKQR